MEIYSEKMGKLLSVSVGQSDPTAEKTCIVMEDSADSLVGWTHNGWNNDNGGAGW